MKRRYDIVITYEVDTKTQHEGLEVAKKMVKGFGFKVQSIKPAQRIRTLKQNRAIHLYLEQWAELFREHGIDSRVIVKEGIPIPPTMEFLKENVWKPTQKALFNKDSTTKLDKVGEIDMIVDVMTKTFGERFGLYVPFPNIDLVLDRFEESLNNQ